MGLLGGFDHRLSGSERRGKGVFTEDMFAVLGSKDGERSVCLIRRVDDDSGYLRIGEDHLRIGRHIGDIEALCESRSFGEVRAADGSKSSIWKLSESFCVCRSDEAVAKDGQLDRHFRFPLYLCTVWCVTDE